MGCSTTSSATPYRPESNPSGAQTMSKGDSLVLDLVFKRADGSAVDLTGAKIWVSLKRSITDLDELALAVVSTTSSQPTGGGVVIGTPATSGKARATIPPAATQSLPLDRVVLQYDVQLKEASGQVTTTERGTVTVSPDVTRNTA